MKINSALEILVKLLKIVKLLKSWFRILKAKSGFQKCAGCRDHV